VTTTPEKPSELQKKKKLTYLTQSLPRRDSGTMGRGWPSGVAALRPNSIRYKRQCSNRGPQTGLPFKAGGHRRAASAVSGVATSLLSGTALILCMIKFNWTDRHTVPVAARSKA